MGKATCGVLHALSDFTRLRAYYDANAYVPSQQGFPIGFSYVLGR